MLACARNVLTVCVLLIGLVPAVSSVNDDLLENPSFDNNAAPWQLNAHVSSWKVQPATHPQLYVQDGQLVFGAKPKEILAVYASQHVASSKFSQLRNPSLQLRYRCAGAPARHAVVTIDISYRDGTNLHVEHNLDCKTDAERESCVIIPAYGDVRSLMIDLVLQHETEAPFWVDDIRLNTISTQDRDDVMCDVYTQSYPSVRHTIYNFLSPSGGDSVVHNITIATQLTIDRLPLLQEMAQLWRGPMSVAFFLLGDNVGDLMRQMTVAYYESKFLRQYASIHLVFQDYLNKQDEQWFPINYLRNVALKGVGSDYVFLLDAGTLPSFTSQQAYGWLQSGIEKSGCDQCAFIAPLFDSKSVERELPTSKQELIQAMQESPPGYEPLRVVSHSPVKYPQWLKASEVYEIAYKPDMEPYFIVSHHAPLMNELYVGYGRDKCAYSRDLHAAGHRFYVLPQAYLVRKTLNRRHAPSLLTRSRGIQLRMHLNIAFHMADIEERFFRYPVNMSVPGQFWADAGQHRPKTGPVPTRSQMFTGYKEDATSAASRGTDKHVEPFCSEEEAGRSGEAHCGSHYAAVTDAEGDCLSEAVIPCNHDSAYLDHTQTSLTDAKPDSADTSSKLGDAPLTSGEGATQTDQTGMDSTVEPSCPIWQKSDFQDLTPLSVPAHTDHMRMLEHIIRRFAIDVVHIIYDSAGRPPFQTLLPHTHVERVNYITRHQHPRSRDSHGIFEYHHNADGLSAAIHSVLQAHTVRCVVWVDPGLNDQEYAETLRFTLQILPLNCLLVTKKEADRVEQILVGECRIADLIADLDGDLIVIKSSSLAEHPDLSLPPGPQLKEDGSCTEPVHIDVVLMTKNRPLQMLAFLQSLHRMLPNLAKIWVIYHADDPLFEQAYERVVECMSPVFTLEMVPEQRGQMGTALQHVFDHMTSEYVIFAVDEIIWLRPVNTTHVGCLMKTNRHTVAAFQLRLGFNVNKVHMKKYVPNREARFYDLVPADGILAYYPLRLPYDFGYVTHVDGLLVHRDDVIRDLSPFHELVHPNRLEHRWLNRNVHRHSRQWHLMYNASRLVNNALKEDGRVLDKGTPEEGSFRLARRLLDDHQQIDIKHFIQSNLLHASTHIVRPVEYQPLTCPTPPT